MRSLSNLAVLLSASLLIGSVPLDGAPSSSAPESPLAEPRPVEETGVLPQESLLQLAETLAIPLWCEPPEGSVLIGQVIIGGEVQCVYQLPDGTLGTYCCP